MRILLVFPTHLDGQNRPLKFRKGYMPPLSLAILKALTPAGHETVIVNDFVQDIDFSSQYDLVGITAMTAQADRAYEIADRFRRMGVKVVIGGIHASMLPQEAALHADSVMIGEAEDLWMQVLDDCSANRLKPTYKSAGYPSLDRQVIPPWREMDLSIYRRSPGRKMPRIPIFTTRGCRNNCKYCAVTKYFGATHRFRPVGNVLEEIDKTGAESYFFVDDNIIANPDYSRELFAALQKKRSSWFGQASMQILKTPDLIDGMARAGCKHLFLGIESIQDANLKSMRKSFNHPEQYKELFDRLQKAGIKPWVSLIFGLDNDTRETLQATTRFLMGNGIWNAVLWILTPLPGTDLFLEMEKERRIASRRWSDYDYKHVVFKPRNFEPEELLQTYWESFGSLFRIPNVLLRTFRMAISGKAPVKDGISSLLLQAHYRNQISRREHPFSMGVEPVPAQLAPLSF